MNDRSRGAARPSLHPTLQEAIIEYEKELVEFEREKKEQEAEEEEAARRREQLKKERQAEKESHKRKRVGISPSSLPAKNKLMNFAHEPESERTCDICLKVLRTASGKAMHKRDVHRIH